MGLPLFRIVVSAAFAFAAPPAGAAETVGMVTKVQADSYQAEQTIGHQLGIADSILMNARVYTKRFGTIHILLDDGSDLLITQNSSITIDRFIYAGDGGGGAFTMTLARGALRAISGRMANESYNTLTPVAAVGVRGTQYWLQADEPGLLKIWADEGVITARPLLGDRTYEFPAPVYAECTIFDCEVTEAPPKPEKFPRDPRAK